MNAKVFANAYEYVYTNESALNIYKDGYVLVVGCGDDRRKEIDANLRNQPWNKSNKLQNWGRIRMGVSTTGLFTTWIIESDNAKLPTGDNAALLNAIPADLTLVARTWKDYRQEDANTLESAELVVHSMSLPA